MELLIHTGVYRDAFFSEPAVAEIVAGAMKMNDDRPSASSGRTLAFDLSDSGRGSMTACSIIATMIRNGQIQRGLVTASEIENNPPGKPRRGLAELGSAIALQRTDDASVGLGEFFFRSYPEFAAELSVSTKFIDAHTELVIQHSPSFDQAVIHCVGNCVDEYLAGRGGEINRYDRILLAVPSTLGRAAIAERLGVSNDKIILPSLPQGDAFTSGLAILWQRLTESGPVQPGTCWLLVAPGSGIEVACVEYQH